MLIRQGDLILHRISDGSTLKNVTPEEVVLAVGEESGHSHITRGVVEREPSTQAPGILHIQSQTILRVGGQPWRHEEISVPPGTYNFWVQRELNESEDIVLVHD